MQVCLEMVVARTGNWQHMCAVHSPRTLSYLMSAACMLDEGVAPTVLQLLQAALCPPPPAKPAPPADSVSTMKMIMQTEL